MIQFQKEKTFTSSRAEYSYETFKNCFKGTVVDIGAGGSPAFFRPKLGEKYFAADVNDLRCPPDIEIDLEKSTLPIEDNSYDTVLCFDCIEHVEDIYSLFDELVRISKKHVIISLPNNWPTFIWSILRGKNITHAYYGIHADPLPKGARHKWWYNIEEAEEFLVTRTKKNNAKVVDLKYIFDFGDALIRIPKIYPDLFDLKSKTIETLATREDLKARGLPAKIAVNLAQKLPTVAIKTLILILKILISPIKLLDETLKFLFWGWGSKFRYLNLFCRQIWIVIEKPQKASLQ